MLTQSIGKWPASQLQTPLSRLTRMGVPEKPLMVNIGKQLH